MIELTYPKLKIDKDLTLYTETHWFSKSQMERISKSYENSLNKPITVRFLEHGETQ